MRPASAAPATLPVVRAAAAFVAAALVLATCAIPPPTPGAVASPSGASPTVAPGATSSPSPATAGLPALVTWERRAPRSLLVAHGPGDPATVALPESANGPPASAPDGRLAFATGGLGGGVVHVGSLANGLAALGWTSVEIPGGMIGPEEALRWVCLGPAGRLAAQTDGGGLLVVEPDGSVRAFERHVGVPRPGGCAWLDGRHLLYAVEGRAGPALAVADVDSDVASVHERGGDAPTASADGTRVAYVRREGARGLVLVGGPPSGDPAAPGAMPPPDLRLSMPLGDADRPVLSPDGSLLGVLFRGEGRRPLALAVYALANGRAEPQTWLDVTGADDAAIAWLAGVP
ncbi:MAG: hypothetical protein A2X23_07480 [Chloroflexi bacterium GWC2_73_18]|nr:MAG: hypothetical protein A2X23_07480 [Chloroflexi bacterium GWC2_73_18]